MRKTSVCKRVVCVLTVIALVCSCALTSLAGNMAAFKGDSGTGKQQIKLTSNGGKITYEMGNDYFGSTRSQYVGTNDVGELIKLSAQDNATRKFMYWTDEYSGRVISYNRDLSFVVSSRVNIRAIFAVISDTQHFVSYVNYGGTRLLDADPMYNLGATVSQPTAGKLPGFTFKGWSMTRDEVSKSTEDVVVYPIYAVNKENYTVEITNDAYVSGAGSYTNFQTVNIKAEPVNGEGKAFSYWKDGDGNIVSYDRDYSFRINYNITLTAVYGETVTPEAVVRVSKIVCDASDSKITFYAERSVPADYTVISHGILMAAGTAQTESTMILSSASDSITAGVRKACGKSNENCGTFSVAKAAASAGTTVYARPYVIVADASGNQFVTYGKLASAAN